MGWIVALKKLFVKKNELHLSLDELPNWLLIKRREILKNDLFLQERKSHIHRLKEARWVVEVKLDETEKLLRNQPDISSYCQDVRDFLHSFHGKHANFLTFNQYIQRRTEQCCQRFEILSTQFIIPSMEEGNSLHPLYEELLNLRGLCTDFDRRWGSSVVNITKLFSKTEELQNLMLEIKSLHKEKQLFQDKLKVAQSKKKGKEEELDQYVSDNAMEVLLQKKEKYDDLISNRETVKAASLQFFSLLKPFLEDFVNLPHTSHREIAINYLDSPLETLQQDVSLSIIHILDHIKALLNNDSVYDELIQQINQANLAVWQRNLHGLSIQISALKFMPFERDLLNDHEEIKYRREHFKSQETRLLSKVEENNSDINSVSNKLRKSLIQTEKAITIALNETVYIHLYKESLSNNSASTNSIEL